MPTISSLVVSWIGCELEEDARRLMEVLPKRLGKYGLSLHPEKSRLVRFHRMPKDAPADPENGVFDFLGFTHYWGKSLAHQAAHHEQTPAEGAEGTLGVVQDAPPRPGARAARQSVPEATGPVPILMGYGATRKR